MAKIKETLKAKVSRLCRTYCLQVWNQALNQAEMEASSTLRRVENVYYPPIIQASSPSGAKVKTAPKNLNPSKDASAKTLPSPSSSPKEVEPVGAVEKEIVKEVALEAPKPPAGPKDSSKEEGVSQSKEIDLVTFLVPTKEDSKGKGPASTATTTAKPSKATTKDNPSLKIK